MIQYRCRIIRPELPPFFSLRTPTHTQLLLPRSVVTSVEVGRAAECVRRRRHRHRYDKLMGVAHL